MALPTDPKGLWHQLVLQHPVETLVAKVREQLSSDLHRAGCPFHHLPENEPLFWIPQLSEHLRKIPAEQLHSLLYLIDLPEKWHRQLMLSEAYFEQLSEAVLYRELVKVYYKLHFSSNQNE